MKNLLDKVLKKHKKEEVKEVTTEAKVEAIIEEVKKQVEEVKYPKPKHFPDCTCFKCYQWKSNNA
jgi:hypothetical protein